MFAQHTSCDTSNTRRLPTVYSLPRCQSDFLHLLFAQQGGRKNADKSPTRADWHLFFTPCGLDAAPLIDTAPVPDIAQHRASRHCIGFYLPIVPSHKVDYLCTAI
jgi:hypothetical protein